MQLVIPISIILLRVIFVSIIIAKNIHVHTQIKSSSIYIMKRIHDMLVARAASEEEKETGCALLFLCQAGYCRTTRHGPSVYILITDVPVTIYIIQLHL